MFLLFKVSHVPMYGFSFRASCCREEWGTTHGQRQAFLEVDMEVKARDCAFE